MAKQLSAEIQGTIFPLKSWLDRGAIKELRFTGKTRRQLIDLLTAGMVETPDAPESFMEGDHWPAPIHQRITPFNCTVEDRGTKYRWIGCSILDQSWGSQDTLVLMIGKSTTLVGSETSDENPDEINDETPDDPSN